MGKIEEELEKSGYITMTNKGASMRPLLKQGKDIMHISVPTQPLHVNDIILFKTEGGAYILHRIRKIGDGLIHTIGDNCTKGESLRQDQVLGILGAVKKKNGRELTAADFTSKAYVFKVKARRLLLRVVRPARHLAGKVFRALF